VPSNPKDGGDDPRRVPERAGSDLEAMRDAFDIDETLPSTIQELIDLVDLYRPSDRLLLIRQYCQDCGKRVLPEHNCSA